jgi:hypothetical protein
VVDVEGTTGLLGLDEGGTGADLSSGQGVLVQATSGANVSALGGTGVLKLASGAPSVAALSLDEAKVSKLYDTGGVECAAADSGGNVDFDGNVKTDGDFFLDSYHTQVGLSDVVLVGNSPQETFTGETFDYLTDGWRSEYDMSGTSAPYALTWNNERARIWTNNKAFRYKTITLSPSHYLSARVSGDYLRDTYIGVRIDDGTNDNYVETFLYSYITNLQAFFGYRYRLGGGSVTTQNSAHQVLLGMWIIAKMAVTGTNIIPYISIDSPASIEMTRISTTAFASGSARVGIFVEGITGSTARSYIDWFAITGV